MTVLAGLVPSGWLAWLDMADARAKDVTAGVLGLLTLLFIGVVVLFIHSWRKKEAHWGRILQARQQKKLYTTSEAAPNSRSPDA